VHYWDYWATYLAPGFRKNETIFVGKITSKKVEYIMLLGHGTVYGEQYYTVAPPRAGVLWRDMAEWCEETFGSSTGSIWHDNLAPGSGERWYQNNSKFWFRSEADQTWFILKWS
jgi:hypothetical protein